MASFINIELLSNASFAFSFILVWIIMYALLSFTKFLEAQNSLRGLLAAVVAILVLLAPPVLVVVQLIVPWFALLFIFISFVLLGLMMFGIDKDQIKKYVSASSDGGNNTVQLWVIIVSLIIFVSALGLVFFTPQSADATDTTETVIAEDGTVTTVGSRGPGAVEAIFFHPKVLGMLFIMLLATFACVQLAK